MIVVVASSVGFSEAVSDRRIIRPTGSMSMPPVAGFPILRRGLKDEHRSLVHPDQVMNSPPVRSTMRWPVPLALTCKGTRRMSSYDLIVIGSGAGGGTLVHRLFARLSARTTEPERAHVL